MAFGIRIYTGTGVFQGIWWQQDEHSQPEALMLDDWEQMLADEKIFEAAKLYAGGQLMPVQRGWEEDPVTPDWLDFLVREARASLRVMVQRTEGPFITNTASAEEMLAWSQEHPDPVPDDRMVKRLFVP